MAPGAFGGAALALMPVVLPANPRAWLRDAREGDGALFERALGVPAAAGLPRLDNMLLFVGSACEELGEEVSYELLAPVGRMKRGRYADGEISVQVLDHVRGKDVFILQSSSQPVNENLVELLLSVSALRRASARSITAVIPYFGYKRDVGHEPSTMQQMLIDVARGADETAPAGGGLTAALAAAHTLVYGGSGIGNDASDEAVSSDGGGGADGASSASGSGEGIAGLIGRARDYAFPVSAADVARMLEVVGVDRVITVDMRLPGQGQSEVGARRIPALTVSKMLASCAAAATLPPPPTPPLFTRQGFFSIPVENIRSTRLAVEHMAKLKPRMQNIVVVAPNEACLRLAQDFQEGMSRQTGSDVGVAVIIEAGPSRGADRYMHSGGGIGGGSAMSSGNAAARGGSPAPLDIVGDVAGRDVIIVDDMVDSGYSLERRIEVLKRGGARRIAAYATHGLFNGSALQRVTRNKLLSDLVVTNTVTLRDDINTRHTHKIAQLSVAPLIAEAILRVQTGTSLQAMR